VFSRAVVAGSVLALGAAGACSSGESPGDGAAGAQPVAGGGGAPSAGKGGAGATSGASGPGGASGSSGASNDAARGGAAGTNAGGAGKSGSTGVGGASGGAGAAAAAGMVAAGAGGGGLAGGGAAGSRSGTGGGGAAAGSGAGGSSGSSNEAPSCATSGPGRTTCGENGNESCCESPVVEGGAFSRTYQNTGSGPTGQADPATVTSFRLDKYEITVGRFREYVKYLSDGGTAPEAGSGKPSHLNGGQGLLDSASSGAFEAGWDVSWNSGIPSGAEAKAQWDSQLGFNSYASWTDDPGDNETLPLTCLNWYESYAFCIWDGGFLPSEAEWRYAAAGGDELRRYPWGSTSPGTDSEYAIYDCCYPDEENCRSSSGMECAGIVNAAPVGFAQLGAGRYGQLDLSGSVFEWLVDRYATFVSPCIDCAYLSGTAPNRVLPGGGFRAAETYLPSSNRGSVSYEPTFRGDFAVGARCAHAP